jgi:hypothetical protein
MIRARWKWGIPIAVIVSIVGLYLSLIILLRHALRTMKVDFSQSSPAVRNIKFELKAINWLARHGMLSTRETVPASSAYLEKESDLLELRTAVSSFESLHQGMPVGVAELSTTLVPNDQSEKLQKLVKLCQITPLPGNSSILNCDGWKVPEKKQLKTLTDFFDSNSDRFYGDDGHVLLYIPRHEVEPVPPGAAAMSP